MNEQTFDYVVIGAGSSGAVVAARLSQDPAVRVALVEAGGTDRRWRIRIPMGIQDLIVRGHYSWGYRTEPQRALDDRQISWPRGKALGGSSSTNAMLYIRGNPLDYDGWAQLGVRGWAWHDVLPYFMRAEDQQRGADAFHGVGGPIGVSDRPNVYPICSDFIDAAKSLGFAWTPDFNGPVQEGVGYYQYTVKRGIRSTTARGYLHPNKRRPNLVVMTNAMVDKLSFEGHRVTGVDVRRNGSSFRLSAGREVIVSGGTVNTPQLLMLSGIGPARDLEALGIPVVADRGQVGKNLQDHLFVRSMYKLNSPLSLNGLYHSLYGRISAALEYAVRRSGPIAYPISPVGIFARSSLATDGPDLQYNFSNYSFEPATSVPHRFHGVSLGVSHLHPTSSGSIKLRSTNPSDPPLIDPNYLSTEHDRTAMMEGLRIMRALVDQPSLKRWISAELDEPAGIGDEDLLAYIRRKAITIYHPVGTCRMGEDQDAVVDSRLRVQGVRGLRVIDASVIPRVISGNTNAAAIMIGEKGADLIIEDASGT